MNNGGEADAVCVFVLANRCYITIHDGTKRTYAAATLVMAVAVFNIGTVLVVAVTPVVLMPVLLERKSWYSSIY